MRKIQYKKNHTECSRYRSLTCNSEADKLCLKKIAELMVLQKDEYDGVIVTILTSVIHTKKNIDYQCTMEKIPIFKKSLRKKYILAESNIAGKHSWK